MPRVKHGGSGKVHPVQRRAWDAVVQTILRDMGVGSHASWSVHIQHFEARSLEYGSRHRIALLELPPIVCAPTLRVTRAEVCLCSLDRGEWWQVAPLIAARVTKRSVTEE